MVASSPHQFLVSHRHRRVRFLVIVLFFFSPACNFYSVATTSEEANSFSEYTRAAQTRQFLWTDLAATPLVSTWEPAESTDKPPDSTASTEIPTITPTYTSSIPCNAAQMLGDVNYPDGTEVAAGTSFTKTWRMRNTGSCTWTSEYSVVFSRGDPMDAPASTPIALGMVPPGAQTDITVDLIAPDAGGTYKGYFFLRSPDGQLFGKGESGNEEFWVNIVVEAASPTPHFKMPPLQKTVIPFLFPAFTANFSQIRSCGVRRMIVFEIANTGTLMIESLQMELQGPVGTVVMTSDQDKPFRPNPDQPFPVCSQEAEENLALGATADIRAIPIPMPESGTSGRAIIKMCSANGLAGKCAEVVVDFAW